MIKLNPNAIIAVDFDGTCVKNHKDFPKVGADIGAAEWLKAWASAGAKLILWTVRSGDALNPAIKWFKDKKIPLWGINENPDQGLRSRSPKAHAHLFADDRGFGVPLVHPPNGEKPYVDWTVMGPVVLAALMQANNKKE